MPKRNPIKINMKTWSLIIGIIVILAMLCSPGLAISKSDLISYYRAQPLSPSDSYNSSSYDQMIQNKLPPQADVFNQTNYDRSYLHERGIIPGFQDEYFKALHAEFDNPSTSGTITFF